MSNFTPTVDHEIEFDGDTIKLKLARLKKGALIKLTPHIGEADENGDIKMSFQDKMEFSNLSKEVLDQHVISFEGLTDAEGSKMELKDIYEEVYFQTLIAQVIGQLFVISKPTKEDKKKSVEPPGDAPKD